MSSSGGDSGLRSSIDRNVSCHPTRVFSFPGAMWHSALPVTKTVLARLAPAHLSQLRPSAPHTSQGIHRLCKYQYFKTNPRKSSLIAVPPWPLAPPPVTGGKGKNGITGNTGVPRGECLPRRKAPGQGVGTTVDTRPTHSLCSRPWARRFSKPVSQI